MRALLSYIGNLLKTPILTVGLIALFFGAFLVVLWTVICLTRLVLG